ncbi:MAG: phosphohistidine phosphatase SixA [bacterium]
MNETKTHEKIIYLVQHGEARTKEEDPARPLSERGKQEVEAVANWAAQAGIQVEGIWHSGKRRAEETANIFAIKLNLENKVLSGSGLAPLDAVEPMAKALAQEQKALLLVSHLPFLNRLASYLLIHDPEKTVVRFRMGGLVGLSEESGNWSVSLIVSPEVIR